MACYNKRSEIDYSHNTTLINFLGIIQELERCKSRILSRNLHQCQNFLPTTTFSSNVKIGLNIVLKITQNFVRAQLKIKMT